MGTKMIIGMFLGLFLYLIFKDLYYYASFIIFTGLVFLIKRKQKYNFLIGEILLISIYLLGFTITLLVKDTTVLKIIILMFSNCFTCLILCKK